MSTMMKVLMFDSKSYDVASFEGKLKETGLAAKISFIHVNESISPGLLTQKVKETGATVICVFVNDNCDTGVIKAAKEAGIKMIALRCAGFNNVAVLDAINAGIHVARVPAYSPRAVAEYSVSMLMTLNRKLHQAFNRVRNNNFSLSGLVGFDLYGKTVGVIGTGKIGKCAIEIFRGFGCTVLAFDIYEDKAAAEQLGFKYTDLDTIYKESHVISLYAPLTKDNYHMISTPSIAKMKQGVVIINTGRGPLIDTVALIEGLKFGKVGGACLDVYENEAGIFYNDVSHLPLQDDVLARLISFNNVIVSSHQAFLTNEALSGISQTTLDNLQALLEGKPIVNEVTKAMVI